MNIEDIAAYSLSLPYVTQDVKWGNDLCFCIAKKMFCVAVLDGHFGVSLKVTDQEFDELSATPGIVSAPYLAHYKWVLIDDAERFTVEEWQHYILQSYQLIKAKLPKYVQEKLS